MKKAVWNDPLTGVATVTIPAYTGQREAHPGWTDDDILNHAIVRAVPPGVVYEIIDDAFPDVHAFLEDRTFRGAWECEAGTGLVCHMGKARSIKMDKIREVRNTELAKLDIPWMKAIEAGDRSAQLTIAERKQELRDIPQTFGLHGYLTPQALANAWPVELG